MRKMSSGLRGFTLVEILIAAGVLSLFMTGLFSFYHMGSRMFMTGSWKQQKQKETERFLSILKERIEMASNAYKIDPASPNIQSQPTTIYVPKDGEVLTNPANNTRLMLFSVCKPDMTAVNQGPGLILYHCLMAVPGEKNLYKLYFHANTQQSAHNGIDYFTTSAQFAPDNPAALGDFSGSPAAFSLLSVPYTIELNDVLSASFSVEIASGTDGLSETEKIIGISLVLQHPRYEETKVAHRIKAKVDYSVRVDDTHELGGF